MKKTKSTSAKSVKEIIEPVVEQLAEQRESDPITVFPPEHDNSPMVEAAPAAAAAPKKARKLVEFKILTSIMEFATEKAQLLAFHTEQDEEVKFWLSKSLLHAIADGDEPDKTICRIPAWLYYKSGLDKFFPVTRWTSQAI